MNFKDFEETTNSNVVARRNHLVALWAGKQFGLSGEKLQRYEMDVHRADLEECGPQDVVRKVEHDLARANIALDDGTIATALAEAETVARRELLVTE